jgi:putative RecB family exonuclease
MAPIVHSASRVAAYQRCPRRYYWRYVVKVPRRRTAAQALGINVHAALEAFERAGGVRLGGESAVREALAATWNSEGFASGEDEARARQEAELCLVRHLEVRQERPDMGEPVMLEQRLEGSLGRFRVVGVVDRLDRLPDGSLRLIDYKTGREDADAVSAPTVQQLAIYRSLVAQATSQAPAEVVVVRPGHSDVPVLLSDLEWDSTLALAQATMAALEADQDYDARVEPSCRRCEFAGRCVPWQMAIATATGAAP